MADAKDIDQKKPGEQPPGKFHYNPGNMAGKTVNDATDPEGARTNSDASVEDLESEAARRRDGAGCEDGRA